MKITIQKDHNLPIYRQIVNQVIEHMKSGELKSGTQLAPEREFAKTLGVSRGTVKKAYETLIHLQYAYSEQGSGTFIKSTALENNRPGNFTGQSIKQLIDDLSGQGFHRDEIKALVNLNLIKHFESGDKANIAVVDCNREALSIIKSRLSYFKSANVMIFLLSDVMDYTFPEEIFRDFDIIFTTATHYQQLSDLLGFTKERIVKAVMSTHRDTILKLAAVNHPEQTGVLTKSKRFGEIISSNLKAQGLELGRHSYLTTENLTAERLKEFMKDKKYLIMPPLFAMNFNLFVGNEILQFGHRDGEIIIFNYTIERGSLIYIEEKIKETLYGKDNPSGL